MLFIPLRYRERERVLHSSARNIYIIRETPQSVKCVCVSPHSLSLWGGRAGVGRGVGGGGEAVGMRSDGSANAT